MRQGRFGEVEALCVASADAIEPRMSRATPGQLAAWGRLLVRAAAAAARNNRPEEARENARFPGIVLWPVRPPRNAAVSGSLSQRTPYAPGRNPGCGPPPTAPRRSSAARWPGCSVTACSVLCTVILSTAELCPVPRFHRGQARRAGSGNERQRSGCIGYGVPSSEGTGSSRGFDPFCCDPRRSLGAGFRSDAFCPRVRCRLIRPVPVGAVGLLAAHPGSQRCG